LYCRAYRVSIARAADAGAPGLALGHAVGRIGCLLGGCCYGRPVDPQFPLAVHLWGAWRHPVQLYEAAGLVLLAIATALAPRALTRRPGATFLAYLGGYACLRLVVEHWRGDDVERGFVVPGLISTSQLIALALLVAGTTLLYRVIRKGAA
jgi:phosphatidylglycerol:prolipoprotein diacylglycerol transferase